MWLDPQAVAPAHGATSAAIASTHADDAASLQVFVSPIVGAQLTVISYGSVSAPPHAVIPFPTGAKVIAIGEGVRAFIESVRACWPHASTPPAPHTPKSPSHAHSHSHSHSHAHSHSHTHSTPTTPTPTHPPAREARADEVFFLDTAAARGRFPAALQPAFDGVYGTAHAFLAHTFPVAERVSLHVAIVHPRASSTSLWIPMRTFLDKDAPASDDASVYLPWSSTFYSVGTARTSDWRGGGKTAHDMIDDMRHRFASGSFKTLEMPTKDWAHVRTATPFTELSSLFPAHAHPHAAPVPVVSTGAEADTHVTSPESSPTYEMHHVSFSDVLATERAKAARKAAERVMLDAIGCVDVFRCKRTALGPNKDVLLTIDDGTVVEED